MPEYREIRTLHDKNTLVVYQAYSPAIADAALAAQRFVAPFSMNRMTWIKPSFLWMMERCGWATKSNQERVLAVRITRDAWEAALSQAVLTSFVPGVHASIEDWRQQFAAAKVHVQWDPERSIRGGKLEHRAIQVGISRSLIGEYVNSWITAIEDMTPLVKKLRAMRQAGKYTEAKALLPKERIYPFVGEEARKLGLSS